MYMCVSVCVLVCVGPHNKVRLKYENKNLELMISLHR